MKNKLKFLQNDGSATVEAVVGFTAFLFTVFTILNIVNVCRAQAIISNAVDTTAKELTQYSYFYQISGLSKLRDQFGEEGDVGTSELNTIASGLNGLMSSISTAGDSAGETFNDVKDLEISNIKADLSKVRGDIGAVKSNAENVGNLGKQIINNPMEYLKYIIAVAGNTALDSAVSHYIAAPISKSMTLKHFGKTTEEADEYLKRLGIEDGVEGLNFYPSTMFAQGSTEELHINCVYKVKVYSFFKGLELDAVCSKSAVARAWLGGDAVKTKASSGTDGDFSPAEKSTDPKATNTEGGTNAPEAETTTEPAAEPKTAAKTGYWEMDYENREESFGKDFQKSHMYCRGALIQSNYVYCESNDGETVYGYVAADDADSFRVPVGAIKQIMDSVRSTEKEAKLPYKETTIYDYTVYVPENMSSEDIEKINKVLEASKKEFLDQGLVFSPIVISAGGNSDYPVE